MAEICLWPLFLSEMHIQQSNVQETQQYFQDALIVKMTNQWIILGHFAVSV